MKLSIVIPALNEEKYLPRLLKSIYSQKYPCEVIVADAQSDDRTSKVAKMLGGKVVSSHRGLPSYARNNGAYSASGDVLLFLDADVVLPKNFLNSAMKEFEKRNLDVAGFYLRPLGNRIFDWFAIEVISNNFIWLTQKFAPHVYGAGIIVRSEVFEEIGGFDEEVTFAEDVDFAKRSHEKGFKFRMVKKKAFVSMRRFDKEGRFWLGLKYLWFHTKDFFGTMKKEQKYSYGDY